MLNQITEHTKACQMVYKSLILKHKPEVFKQFDKWKVTLNNQNINQRTIFSQPIKLTIDTKLRNFQYKYLMHILPNNTFLHKCNLVPSTLCDFCHMHTETDIHVFWDCHPIQKFWMDIQNFIYDKLERLENLELNFATISFCNLTIADANNSHVINFIILLAKYFIFKCKQEKTIPLEEAFVSFFNTRIKLEELIATTQNKLHIFNTRWAHFMPN